MLASLFLEMPLTVGVVALAVRQMSPDLKVASETLSRCAGRGGLIDSALYQRAIEASLELKEVIESTPQSIWPTIGQILSKLHKLPFSKQINYETDELKKLSTLYRTRMSI